MTVKQAYTAGFLLKCAEMGLPAERANELLKSALLGQAIGTVANLGIGAGKGVLDAAGSTVQGAGELGELAGKETIDRELSLPNLQAAQKLIVAEHDRRALQSLQAARASQKV